MHRSKRAGRRVLRHADVRGHSTLRAGRVDIFRPMNPVSRSCTSTDAPPRRTDCLIDRTGRRMAHGAGWGLAGDAWGPPHHRSCVARIGRERCMIPVSACSARSAAHLARLLTLPSSSARSAARSGDSEQTYMQPSISSRSLHGQPSNASDQIRGTALESGHAPHAVAADPSRTSRPPLFGHGRMHFSPIQFSRRLEPVPNAKVLLVLSS